MECPICKKEVCDGKPINKCKVINDFCDFALENGDCGQPGLSVEYLKCFDKIKDKKLNIKGLREIYDKRYVQAGDTAQDFYEWAINYLLEKITDNTKNLENIKREVHRHIIGIEKAVEKIENIKIKNLIELRFFLIGYGLNVKDVDKIIEEIEIKKQ